jgi:hypothetical protein
MTLFDYETAEAEATRQPDYPATWAAMPATPGSPGSNLRFNTFLPRILMASLSKVVVAEYRNRYDRRAAAIALAARLYEAEHGRAPATIAEMVPEFLPRVPLDPMAGRGTPMPYTPATRPTTAPDPQ